MDPPQIRHFDAVTTIVKQSEGAGKIICCTEEA